MRINDCHKRINIHEKACERIEKYLHEGIPEHLLNIVKRISDKRKDRIKAETRIRLDKKLNALFEKTSRKQKAPENWVKNISNRVLDKDEVSVLSYGMKHSLAPKRLPTAKILASVEAAIRQKQNLSIETKETIRGKVASTLQSSIKPVNNLSKDEQLALSRLRKDDTIVITPADKGRVTVVMNKAEYHEKMGDLVNDDKTYKQLKRTPQRNYNGNLTTNFFNYIKRTF